MTSINLLLCLSSFLALTLFPGYAASLSGAIFTTTPDGGIVNENVRYNSKLDVYLDGGPPPHAPARAAGLPDGWYIFQVTNPSGSVQLSEDPAKCRILEVRGGVIVRLVLPSELGLDNCYTMGKGKKAICYTCHIQDEPDGVAGPSGRHDTNTDLDHGDGADAIVVQLMPFLDTPNPGGVYKAWMIPLERYLANGGDLEEIPANRGWVRKKGKILGFKPDPAFGPPRDQSKTDNFKVKETESSTGTELRVRKFHDLNLNGIWDEHEPEIGTEQLIDGGGWPVEITDPLLVTNNYFTPVLVTAEPPGDYTVRESVLLGWYQTATYLDGAFLGVTDTVTVAIAGLPDEQHEVIFGNFKPVDIYAHKFFDRNENSVQDGNEQDLADIEICLTQNGDPVTENAFGDPLDPCQFTDDDGMVYWFNLRPGTYTISENLAGCLNVGLYPTTPPTVTVEVLSGQETVIVEFGNVGPCSGLTPGYWRNWRNHYTPDQFALLLKGTIADLGTDIENIAAADTIFDHWDASDPKDLTILKAFVLANQLTINLTQKPDLPNPSEGSLFYACLLTFDGETMNMGETLALALEIINDPSSYSDIYILNIKDILDAFANYRTQ